MVRMYKVRDPIGWGGRDAARSLQFLRSGRCWLMPDERDPTEDAGVVREQHVGGRMGLRGLRGAVDLSRNRCG